MICLGISEDLFDAGVTLCDGESVVFATNEERYTRRKNEGGFPRHALAGLFDYSSVNPGNIEQIYVVGHMTPPFPVRLFPWLHYWLYDTRRSKQETWFKKLVDFAMFMTPVSHTSEHSIMRKLTRPLLAPVTRRTLPKALRRIPIDFIEHHTAHAAGAWNFSGFEEALAVTADGMGDGLSLSVSRCDHESGVQRLWQAASRDSFGLFFELLTEAFGFVPCRDEGKITGLAASGDPARVKEPAPFSLVDGRLKYTGPYGRRGVAWVQDELKSKYSREDISAWAQDLLETHIVEVARWWLEETGLRHLVVAGGVFANVKLNQRLHELNQVDGLFVLPNMGDGGLSLGAIAVRRQVAPQRLRDVFWGEDYTDDAVEAVLKRAGVSYERRDDPDGAVAALLAEGHTVARFQGRMEWGPRALGNRSILVRTTDAAVVDRLNDQLDRSEFMPFAPAMLDEDAEEYLVAPDPARHTAQFMTVCFDCTEKMKRENPAVVHVDGTARAQLVAKDTNPTFHRILAEYKQRSGSSVILNTSFNIHEEPIVRTPDEGVTAFLRAGLDYLSMGCFMVKAPHLDARPEAGP